MKMQQVEMRIVRVNFTTAPSLFVSLLLFVFKSIRSEYQFGRSRQYVWQTMHSAFDRFGHCLFSVMLLLLIRLDLSLVFGLIQLQYLLEFVT